MTSNAAGMPTKQELDVVTAAMNEAYYYQTYPDVAAAGVPAALHYCMAGWQEERNPSSEFDTAFYLRRNRDVADAGTNPFFHYLTEGRLQGRESRSVARAPLDILIDGFDRPPTVDHPSEVAHAIADYSVLARARLPGLPTVVSISHDDYLVNVGGVQNVIADEEAAGQSSWNYLHLSPALPSSRLAGEGAPSVFSARLNQVACGYVDAATVAQWLEAEPDVRQVWVIHHLMGHSPEVLVDLWRRSSGTAKVYFWVHDHFATCSNYALLRNDVTYCGAPSPNSPACGVCRYGEERLLHLGRIDGLLEAMKPTVLFPSDSARQVWGGAKRHPLLDTMIVPPAFLVETDWVAVPRTRRPLRIAFVGTAAHHKGWKVFESLVRTHAYDDRYEFVQFSAEPAALVSPNFSHVACKVTRESRAAMIEALIYNQVDAAVFWSLCAETFSFTVHEALAAGAFIIGRVGAGNQWAVLQTLERQNYLALASESALCEAFRSDRVASAVLSARPTQKVLVPNSGTNYTIQQLLARVA